MLVLPEDPVIADDGEVGAAVDQGPRASAANALLDVGDDDAGQVRQRPGGAGRRRRRRRRAGAARSVAVGALADAGDVEAAGPASRESVTTGPSTTTPDTSSPVGLCRTPPVMAATSRSGRGITTVDSLWWWRLRALRAARSSSRSSKGWTVPWTSWPVSWPLPSDRDGVARPGEARRRRGSRRRVRRPRARRWQRPPPVGGRTGRRRAPRRGSRRGPRERGLSSVTTTTSAHARGGGAHRLPLAGVAVATGAEDGDQRPRWSAGRRARQGGRDRVGGVGEVDDRQRRAVAPRRRRTRSIRPGTCGSAWTAPDDVVVGQPAGGEHERRPARC